jgi:hypothetical protein
MTEDGNPDDAALLAALVTERTHAWLALTDLDAEFRGTHRRRAGRARDGSPGWEA